MSAVLDTPALAPARALPTSTPVDPAFARDVLAGLARTQKSIPCTWLYDHRGSALFEQITTLPEYYPTRTETWILERCAAQIAAEAGARAVVVELGSGSSRKTPLLLAALDTPSLYVPVDISAQFLAESVAALTRDDMARHLGAHLCDCTIPAGGEDRARRNAGACRCAGGREYGQRPGSARTLPARARHHDQRRRTSSPRPLPVVYFSSKRCSRTRGRSGAGSNR